LAGVTDVHGFRARCRTCGTRIQLVFDDNFTLLCNKAMRVEILKSGTPGNDATEKVR
jgi:hypothetical protein